MLFCIPPKMRTIRTFVKGKTAANDFMLNICTLQFIVCKSLLTIILMHIGFKEYKLHLSWVPIIYFSLDLFISIFLGILFILGLCWNKEKDVSKKEVLVSSAKIDEERQCFHKKRLSNWIEKCNTKHAISLWYLSALKISNQFINFKNTLLTHCPSYQSQWHF